MRSHEPDLVSALTRLIDSVVQGWWMHCPFVLEQLCRSGAAKRVGFFSDLELREPAIDSKAKPSSRTPASTTHVMSHCGFLLLRCIVSYRRGEEVISNPWYLQRTCYGSSRMTTELGPMDACGVASHPCLDGFHPSQALQTS